MLRVTVADITLYAYTVLAPLGGFDLDAFPALRAWLWRIENLPEHVPRMF